MVKYLKTMLAMLLLAAGLQLSGCSLLHDGSGWEHNMDDESSSYIEHQH